jgi:hypothetical protein
MNGASSGKNYIRKNALMDLLKLKTTSETKTTA